MPLDFTGLLETLQGRKRKQPVAAPVRAQTPPIAAPPAPEPKIESPGLFRTPDFNPTPFNPQPKMQPVGDLETAEAPRYYQIDPKLIGGGRLQSEEELTDLRSKGLVRPKNNFSFGERLKAGLKGLLPGLAQGGLGGAITGAVGSAIDPRQGRRFQFETFDQPQIDAEKAKRAAEEGRRADIAGRNAKAALENAQAQKALRLPPIPVGNTAVYNQETGSFEQNPYAPERNVPAKDDYIQTPRGLYQISTGKIIEGTDKPEPQPSYTERYQSELGNVMDEWGDPREVATSSTDARKESIIDSLPDLYKSVLRTRQRPDGSPATSKDITDAQEAFNKAREHDIDEGEKVDRRKREGEARRRVAGNRRQPAVGGGRSGRTAISLEEAAKLLK